MTLYSITAILLILTNCVWYAEQKNYVLSIYQDENGEEVVKNFTQCATSHPIFKVTYCNFECIAKEFFMFSCHPRANLSDDYPPCADLSCSDERNETEEIKGYIQGNKGSLSDSVLYI